MINMSQKSRPDERRREEAKLARANQVKPLAEDPQQSSSIGESKFSILALPNQGSDSLSQSVLDVLGPFHNVLTGFNGTPAADKASSSRGSSGHSAKLDTGQTRLATDKRAAGLSLAQSGHKSGRPPLIPTPEKTVAPPTSTATSSPPNSTQKVPSTQRPSDRTKPPPARTTKLKSSAESKSQSSSTDLASHGNQLSTSSSNPTKPKDHSSTTTTTNTTKSQSKPQPTLSQRNGTTSPVPRVWSRTHSPPRQRRSSPLPARPRSSTPTKSAGGQPPNGVSLSELSTVPASSSSTLVVSGTSTAITVSATATTTTATTTTAKPLSSVSADKTKALTLNMNALAETKHTTKRDLQGIFEEMTVAPLHTDIQTPHKVLDGFPFHSPASLALKDPPKLDAKTSQGLQDKPKPIKDLPVKKKAASPPPNCPMKLEVPPTWRSCASPPTALAPLQDGEGEEEEEEEKKPTFRGPHTPPMPRPPSPSSPRGTSPGPAGDCHLEVKVEAASPRAKEQCVDKRDSGAASGGSKEARCVKPESTKTPTPSNRSLGKAIQDEEEESSVLRNDLNISEDSDVDLEPQEDTQTSANQSKKGKVMNRTQGKRMTSTSGSSSSSDQSSESAGEDDDDDDDEEEDYGKENEKKKEKEESKSPQSAKSTTKENSRLSSSGSSSASDSSSDSDTGEEEDTHSVPKKKAEEKATSKGGGSPILPIPQDKGLSSSPGSALQESPESKMNWCLNDWCQPQSKKPSVSLPAVATTGGPEDRPRTLKEIGPSQTMSFEVRKGLHKEDDEDNQGDDEGGDEDDEDDIDCENKGSDDEKVTRKLPPSPPKREKKSPKSQADKTVHKSREKKDKSSASSTGKTLEVSSSKHSVESEKDESSKSKNSLKKSLDKPSGKAVKCTGNSKDGSDLEVDVVNVTPDKWPAPSLLNGALSASEEEAEVSRGREAHPQGKHVERKDHGKGKSPDLVVDKKSALDHLESMSKPPNLLSPFDSSDCSPPPGAARKPLPSFHASFSPAPSAPTLPPNVTLAKAEDGRSLPRILVQVRSEFVSPRTLQRLQERKERRARKAAKAAKSKDTSEACEPEESSPPLAMVESRVPPIFSPSHTSTKGQWASPPSSNESSQSSRPGKRKVAKEAPSLPPPAKLSSGPSSKPAMVSKSGAVKDLSDFPREPEAAGSKTLVTKRKGEPEDPGAVKKHKGESTPHESTPPPSTTDPPGAAKARRASTASIASPASTASSGGSQKSNPSRKSHRSSVITSTTTTPLTSFSSTPSTTRVEPKVEESNGPVEGQQPPPTNYANGSHPKPGLPANLPAPPPVEYKLEGHEHYMARAKEHKHHADNLKDKRAKLEPYLRSGLNFYLAGYCMEEKHNSYNMYRETSTLLQFAIKLRSNSSSLEKAEVSKRMAEEKEKKILVLIIRLRAYVNQRMYHVRRGEVIRLKNNIETEQNKMQSSSKPSPHQSKNSTGTPSSMSPTPSPAGSVSSQGSCELPPGKLTNGTSSTALTSPSPGMVTLHQRMQGYFSLTSHLVKASELWERADDEARGLEDFFSIVDNACGPLAFHSHPPVVVRYMKHALKLLNLHKT